MKKSEIGNIIDKVQEDDDVDPPPVKQGSPLAEKPARRRSTKRDQIEQLSIKLDFKTREWILHEVSRRKARRLPGRTIAEVVTEAIALLRLSGLGVKE